MFIGEKCRYSKYINITFIYIYLKFDTVPTKTAMGLFCGI